MRVHLRGAGPSRDRRTSIAAYSDLVSGRHRHLGRGGISDRRVDYDSGFSSDPGTDGLEHPPLAFDDMRSYLIRIGPRVRREESIVAAKKPNLFDVARDAAKLISSLEEAQRPLALRFVAESLGLSVPPPTATNDNGDNGGNGGGGGGGGDPGAFMEDKSPQGKIQEVTCLGYFLQKVRGKDQWNSDDIAALNTESGGNALNLPKDLNNARAGGVVVTVGTRDSKLTRKGEKVVEALPDKAAARAAVSGGRPRRRAGTKKTAKNK